MYVRSKINGMISRITDIEQFEELGKIVQRYILDNNYNVGFCSTEKDSVIASYNIIDLIEAGDYVNGSKVSIVESEFIYWETGNAIHHKYIETILTREQFTQAEYKIKEDK